MKKSFQLVGFIGCMAAVLAMSGGHWFALQSLAWGRMIAEYSRHDSFGAALSRTFSGKYPCPLCLKIREGWRQDKQREQRAPWLKTEKVPELLWELRCATIPAPPIAARHEQPFVPTLHANFIESPPTPPPRFLFATL